MEHSPFYPLERADSNSNSTDKKSGSSGYAAQYRPPERVSHEPPARVERPPIAPPIEGIISWPRDRQDELNTSSTSEKSKDSKDEEESDDEGKDAKSSKPTKPQPIQSPLPLLQEIQATTAEDTQESDEESTDDTPVVDSPVFAYPGESTTPVPRQETAAESDEDTVQPQRPRPMAPALGGSRLDDFPPLAPREASVAQRFTASTESMPDDLVESTEDQDDYQQPTMTPAPLAAPADAPRANIWDRTPNVAPRQAEDEQDDAFDHNPVSAPHAGAAGGQPPVPPINHVAAYNQQPMGPGYGASYNQYTHPATQYDGQFNAAPSAAPAMPIERPGVNPNYDPRLGQVGAVLGLGLLAEHIGRKRGDRKVEKRVNERMDDKLREQNETSAIDQRRLQEQQRQFGNEQQQQIAEMQRMRRSQEQFTVAPPAEQYLAAPAPMTFESAPNAGPSYITQQVEGRPMHPNERPQIRPEAQLVAPVVNLEQQSSEQLAIEQNYNLQPNQHVEHSAWHNIVVDDRGHEVTGAINYGEGFKRERQQEMIRDRVADGSAAGAAGQAQYQQQGQFAGPTYPSALPSGMTTPGLPQGQPTHADAQHQLEASNKQPSTNITNPWFWIMMGLVIAAFFTAAAI